MTHDEKAKEVIAATKRLALAARVVQAKREDLQRAFEELQKIEARPIEPLLKRGEI